MGFFSSFADFMLGPIESKSNATTHNVPQHSPEAIEAALRDAQDGSSALSISAVYVCARIIAEGLAKPPCYLHLEGPKGKTVARAHPLYSLLNASPNDRQTSYEFREQLGFHLALNGDAFVWINRDRETNKILELLPCDPGAVTVEVDTTRLGGEVTYRLYGIPMPKGAIWHLKGPSWLSHEGMTTLNHARNAIGLARATETFGANLFKNGARPGGLLTPSSGVPLTGEQTTQLKAAWTAQSGVNNAHRTMLLPAGVDYKPLANTANDSQWIDSRRFQIEEICRFFRVSPTKAFQALGSQSYSSVEQAHIAHDQDTDAHWHERFMQSANKALLSAGERANGYTVTIDNRDFLRGTAKERMEYYNLGIASGIISRNEAREMEGFDRSNDASADLLTPAVNIFGENKPGRSSDK